MNKDKTLTRAQQVIRANNKALEQPTVAELNNEYLRDTNVIGLEQPAQEPVAWTTTFDTTNIWESPESPGSPFVVPLYTHPHQWQGLTDDEALQIYIDDPAIAGHEDPHLIKYARAIEQALKEKNHG
jgi:hypothetical protein